MQKKNVSGSQSFCVVYDSSKDVNLKWGQVQEILSHSGN